ncbi:MAG: hypothetical protein AAF518_22800 [Spirochaetota bacterium]
MNPILEELQRMHDDLVVLMKASSNWKNQKKNIEILNSLAIKEIGESMETDLVESFAFWMDSEMTGMDTPKPLGCVYFEYDYEDNEALGFGYEVCKPKEGEVFIKREEYDLEDDTFYDCGGIDISAIVDCEYEEDDSSEFVDLQGFKIAEALHYGIKKAIQSENFTKLVKKNTVYFLIGRHDRWPSLAYLWEK